MLRVSLIHGNVDIIGEGPQPWLLAVPDAKKRKAPLSRAVQTSRGSLLRYLLVVLAMAFNAAIVGAGHDDEFTAFFPRAWVRSIVLGGKLVKRKSQRHHKM